MLFCVQDLRFTESRDTMMKFNLLLLLLFVGALVHADPDEDVLDDESMKALQEMFKEEDRPWEVADSPKIGAAKLKLIQESNPDSHRKRRAIVTWNNKPRFDAREEWPHCRSIGEIWNQGPCHTCWAVSAASVLTDRYCIATDKRTTVYFSAIQAAACVDKTRDWKPNCKVGAALVDVFFTAQKYGIATGGMQDHVGNDAGCVPYTIPGMVSVKGMIKRTKSSALPHITCADTCSGSEDPFSIQRATIATHGVWAESDEASYLKKNQDVLTARVNKMKYEISTNGPIAAHIEVHPDFVWYGVKPLKNGNRGVYSGKHIMAGNGHYVRIIGWDDAKEAWLVVNTWGTWWGDQGYGWIKMGVNKVGIEDEVAAPIIHSPDPAINACQTATFCGVAAAALDLVIPIDPKDPNTPFYLVQGTCLQKAVAKPDGSLELIGLALPIQWVFEFTGAAVTLQKMYKLMEERIPAQPPVAATAISPAIPEAPETTVIALHIYPAARASTIICIRVADNKFTCRFDFTLAVPQFLGARSMFVDKNVIHSLAYKTGGVKPTLLTDDGVDVPISGYANSDLDAVNSVVSLVSSKKVLLFGNKGAAGQYITLDNPKSNDLKGFTMSSTAKSSLACPVTPV